MALFAVAPPTMKPVALAMNVVVALIGTWRFAAAGLVPWRLCAPLVAGSIPAAFAGGLVALDAGVHRRLLGASLVAAAARLWLRPGGHSSRSAPPPAAALAALGAVLGALAGLTGIGGGVFLSPIVLLAGWEEPRRTAGASASFILVNSAAGLAGHVVAGGHVPAAAAPLALVALAGGLYGSWLGAHRLPPLVLRRLLAVVLLVAAVKLLAGG
jgi:hypothetical protein